MGFCPKCKCEYVEGVRVCVDCGCELVDQLPKENKPDFLDEESAGEMAAMLMEQAARDDDSAREFLKDFAPKEPEEKTVYKGAYVNNAERAEENRTSAYTLLLVGGIGLVAVILFFLDLLPIRMSVVSKYMISGVMGAMFLLFLIMGIVSMRNSRILERKARKENNLTEEIRRWCRENLSGEQIDYMLELDESTTEELKYFQRFEKVGELIRNQFLNLDESYLDRLIDEIYPDIFEDRTS